MRRNAIQGLIALIVALTVAAGTMAADRKRRTDRMKVDTVALTVRMGDLGTSRRMMSSAFPVEIQIHGKTVQVKSDQGQFLPIYTRGGILYMTARLNKGTNWINGLPHGRYFINNRPITIN